VEYKKALDGQFLRVKSTLNYVRKNWLRLRLFHEVWAAPTFKGQFDGNTHDEYE